jgi:DNA-binding response OmpR family regulator
MKNGYRLLVVEDDASLCETLADLLRITGYEVDTAESGEAALRLLRDAPPPDAILLDVVLPRMNADHLLQEMDVAVCPRPPVVLMTGMISSARIARESDVLMKPFDADELLARLERACGSPGAPLHH